MRFAIMEQVYIQSDILGLDAPVGEMGYIAQIDRRIDQAQSYCVRVPSKKRWYWLTEQDLCNYDEWCKQSADNGIRTALVNHALETGNKELFEAQAQVHNNTK